MVARYDGLADWYDTHLGEFTTTLSSVVRELLGAGTGRCLDLGCGGGIHAPVLLDLGWSVTGVDVSADQLRVARRRVGGQARFVRADASSLPFGDAEFVSAVGVLVHTDVHDYGAVLRETSRVLTRGGRFVHVGVHPCFVGPFSRYQGPEEPPILYRGYRDTGWTDDAPGFGDGIRRRVGSRHVPLADLLNGLLAAGFRLDRFEEPSGSEFPRVLAVAATRK